MKSKRKQCGTSLVELMVAMAISSLVLGSTLGTFIAQQRTFVSALYQMDAQSDESRVMSYLSRDLRNASSVQLQSGGTVATLTIPAPTTMPTAGEVCFHFNLNLGLPLLSLLFPPDNDSSSTPPSTSNVTTIQYFRQGASIIREVNGVATSLTNSAAQFTITQSGSLARVDTSFQPRFSLLTRLTTLPTTQVTSFVYLANAN